MKIEKSGLANTKIKIFIENTIMVSNQKTKNFLKEYAREFSSTKRAEQALSLISSACKKAGVKETDYLDKALEVSLNLLKLRAGENAVIAGLIYDPVKLKIIEKEVEKEYGRNVVDIIDQKIALTKALEYKPENRENSRKKLLVVLSTNPDVVLLQLSELLVKLKNLEELSSDGRKKFVNEIKEIYAPLAHQLGIYNLSFEMNDLAFKFNDPKTYSKIGKQIKKTLSEMNQDIENTKKIIEKKLREANVEAVISGRIKSIYSTYSKIQRKKVGITQISDLIALRVVTNNERDCYETLGIIHGIWKPITGEFDDYIAKPKENGYRSLHTAIISDKNNPIEIQIRTKEMHDFAEYGIASHSRYKGDKGDAKTNRKIDWVKQVLEWQKSTGGKTDLDLFGKDIFALTPKGKVIELPEGATALDFAYMVHTDIGNKCQTIKINGSIAPLNAIVKTGDIIEIHTSQKQKPKIGWLSFVKTAKAKQKIKRTLQIETKTRVPAKAKKYTIKTSHEKIKLAKCCSPLPGDEITGLKTTKRKISVHRKDCRELNKLKGTKIEVDWHEKSTYYDTELIVNATDRLGLLKDILDTISKNNVRVGSANARLVSGNNVVCTFALKIKDLNQFEELMKKTKQVNGVTNVYRE